MKITSLANYNQRECGHNESVVLIGFRAEMSCHNFPYENIAGADDLASRLSLFKHILLTSESLSIFKGQVFEYRTAVSKQSGASEVAGAGAMMMAAEGARFDVDALNSIKDIRDFCKKNGSDTMCSSIKTNDFKALGLCVASSVSLQIMEREGLGDLQELGRMVHLEQPGSTVRSKFQEYYFSICDWIEGDLSSLHNSGLPSNPGAITHFSFATSK